MQRKMQVFAVLREDTDIEAIEDRVTVKEILRRQEDAEAEVARLNRLNSGKGARYYWQATRYFPKGRKAER
jgi:hypothetical protein